MFFTPPLQPCRFLRRWKRFLAEVELPDGQVLVVHVPNSGSMLSCLEPGRPALISHSSNPARKLAHTLEMVADDTGWIVLNTLRANPMAREALQGGHIPGVDSTWHWQAEVRRRESRLDFLGTRGREQLWVEVKSVTLRLDDGWAAFPDSVTLRGQKHMQELMAIAKAGGRAMLLLMVQRQGLAGFKAAHHLDPRWAELYEEARRAGVDVHAIQVVGDAQGLRVGDCLPLATCS